MGIMTGNKKGGGGKELQVLPQTTTLDPLIFPLSAANEQHKWSLESERILSGGFANHHHHVIPFGGEMWGQPWTLLKPLSPGRRNQRSHTNTCFWHRRGRVSTWYNYAKIVSWSTASECSCGTGALHAAWGWTGRCCSSLEETSLLCGVNQRERAESEHQVDSVCTASTNTYTIMETVLFQRFSVPIKCLIPPLFNNSK